MSLPEALLTLRAHDRQRARDLFDQLDVAFLASVAPWSESAGKELKAYTAELTNRAAGRVVQAVAKAKVATARTLKTLFASLGVNEQKPKAGKP